MFEIGSTPAEKLQLLTPGFEQKDVAKAFQAIDVESADCFDPSAKALIRQEIAARHGSIARFTSFLRLRFLLRPIVFDEDVGALLGRSGGGGGAWDFAPLREWVAPERGCVLIYQHNSLLSRLRVSQKRARVEVPADVIVDSSPPARRSSAAKAQSLIACVTAGPGEGKSTVSAALVAGLGQAPGAALLHAHHFCARGDARRSDMVSAVRTLAYQLAMRFPPIMARDTRTYPHPRCASSCAVLHDKHRRPTAYRFV